MTQALIFATLILFVILLSKAQECDSLKYSNGIDPRVSLSDSLRSLSVQGYGEVSMTPDICYITFKSTSNDALASAAYKNHQQKIRAILSAMKDSTLGINERDMQTRGLSLLPVYKYINNKNGESK